MSKDAVIAELLTLPASDQREILHLLLDRLGDDADLSEEQERELDRRIDRFERDGSCGEPWDKVYRDLSQGI
jgi:putative addiction module component (TIGR02574 family)